ncbi:hypothetical protein ACQR3P_29465 [Rhodococcus sp. IEGM1300]
MAKERIQLVSDEVARKTSLRAQLKSGGYTKEDYDKADTVEKGLVKELLFDIAIEPVNPHHGASAIEFMVFAGLRLMMKKFDGVGYTQEDFEIDRQLREILKIHELSNGEVDKADFLFDYLSYAQHVATGVIANREQHIARKVAITGES